MKNLIELCIKSKNFKILKLFAKYTEFNIENGEYLLSAIKYNFLEYIIFFHKKNIIGTIFRGISNPESKNYSYWGTILSLSCQNMNVETANFLHKNEYFKHMNIENIIYRCKLGTAYFLFKTYKINLSVHFLKLNFKKYYHFSSNLQPKPNRKHI